MSIEAHSSHDDGLKWSREEINAWLDTQPSHVQDMARNLGRKWINEGSDLVAGFNIFRHMLERSRPALSLRPTGIWDIFQQTVLGYRRHKINNNLRNLGRDMGSIKQALRDLSK